MFRRSRLIVSATAVMAAIVIAGVIYDVARPCKKFSDRLNRDALASLAGWTGQKDQWLVFNALQDVPYAPDIHRYGGSGARFRYYVRQFGPANIRWAPPAKQVSAPEGGRTWLIIYRDNKRPFRQDLLEPYLQIVQRRLGLSKRHWFKLTSPKDRHRREIEGFEVYEFGPFPPDA